MRKKLIVMLLLIIYIICFPAAVYAEAGEDTWQNLDQYLEQSVQSLHIPGMAVLMVDRDKVLFANTYGNCNSVDTPFIIGSLSKSFTAVSVLQLVEQKKIRLEDKVSVYLPDTKIGDKITIRQLLNQTSGLGTYQSLSNMKITGSYGKHQYANVNYGLLGRIIEAASGVSYEEYVTEHILRPLAMTHSGASLKRSKENGLIDGYRNFFGIPVSGEPNYPHGDSWGQVSAGYISSSASDMGKYLQMYLRGGENVVSESSIHTMFYDNVYVDCDKPYYYGMGWVLSNAYEEPVLEHSGLVENYMSNMFILPESGIGAIFLINTNDYLVSDSMIDSMNDNVLKLLEGKTLAELSKTKYITMHLLFDIIYLVVFLTAFLPFLSWKRYRRKLPALKRGKIFAFIGLFNMVLPTALLLLPRLICVPLWLVRYYVPDLFLVLVTSAALLYVGGAVKLIMLFKTRNIPRLGSFSKC